MMAAVDFAHLAGGIMLLCGFSLLSQRRLAGMIALYQLQALALTAAAFGQGLAQTSPDLILTGLLTLGLKGMVLPLFLRRIVIRFGLIRAAETVSPVAISMLLGVGLIGAAVLAVPPDVPLNREDLAIALSILLLGFLMMVTRRNGLAQVIGFLSAENGLVLAALCMPGMPFVAELSVALLVMLAVLVVAVFLARLREHFDTLDLTGIEAIERRGR